MSGIFISFNNPVSNEDPWKGNSTMLCFPTLFFLLDNMLYIFIYILDNIEITLGNKKYKIWTLSQVSFHMFFIPAYGKHNRVLRVSVCVYVWYLLNISWKECSPGPAQWSTKFGKYSHSWNEKGLILSQWHHDK
jgi:hypothetical protein